MVAPLHGKKGILSQKMCEEKLESEMPVFNEKAHNDFHLWQLRMEAVLREKELIPALINEKLNQ